MNKFAPLLSVVGLCLLTPLVNGRAQAPSTPEPGAAANAAAPGGAAVTSPNDTEILSNQGATFSAKDRVAVFSGSVRVNDPRFTIFCDELTAYLAKGAASATTPTPASGTPPPVSPAAKAGAETPGGSDRSGGLDHAVAKGNVIIIQKHAPTKAGEEEKVSICHSETAEYDSKTGDMTLRGMPKVEQNGDSHEALSRSTYMILHRDNSLETHGPSSTHIAPRGNSNLPGGSPPAGSPGRRTPPSGKQS